jgi:hypothetical protein
MTTDLTLDDEKFTEDSYVQFMNAHSNWGRWGDADERGTLNLITGEKTVSAAALIQTGQSVSCARRIEWAPKPPQGEAPIPPIHFMLRSGEMAPPGTNYSAYDWVGMPLHGLYITHLDAHSHCFWDRQGYNGVPSSAVKTDIGATKLGVDNAGDGMATRGVLLDIPAVRGVASLEDGDQVTVADLLAAEELAGTQVEAGDVAYVRTGYAGRRGTAPTDIEGTWTAQSTRLVGLSPESARWLWDRSPAVLATDSGTDKLPSPYKVFRSPIHAFTIVFMGMWILDGCDLEAVSERAAAEQRYSFFTTLAPLKLKNSTGSPLNPIAIF